MSDVSSRAGQVGVARGGGGGGGGQGARPPNCLATNEKFVAKTASSFQYPF